MHVKDEFGLPVAEADAAEALAAHRTGDLPAAAVLRVIEPPEQSWLELAAAGFVRKAAWLTWIAPTPDSDADLLHRLPRKSRQDLGRALARAREAGLRVSVQQPILADDLDAFFDLYEQAVSGMRYGVAFARRMRDAMMTDPHYLAVFAHDGDELVGGCIGLESPEHGLLWLRYSAVTKRWRALSLARALYREAFHAARERGFPRVTLGNDPNLYGHIARAENLIRPGHGHFDHRDEIRCGYDLPAPTRQASTPMRRTSGCARRSLSCAGRTRS